MIRCCECAGEQIRRVSHPGILDEVMWGPLGKHVFVAQTHVTICETCGEVATDYHGLNLMALCEVVKFRYHERN